MERAYELGIEVPKSLEGWADFFPRYTVLPWLKGRGISACRRCANICGWRSDRIPIGRQSAHPVARWIHESIAVPARWRLDHDIYALPFELWMKEAAAKILPAPKPKVDAQRLESEVVTC